jgi:hypothetical protein
LLFDSCYELVTAEAGVAADGDFDFVAEALANGRDDLLNGFEGNLRAIASEARSSTQSGMSPQKPSRGK